MFWCLAMLPPPRGSSTSWTCPEWRTKRTPSPRCFRIYKYDFLMFDYDYKYYLDLIFRYSWLGTLCSFKIYKYDFLMFDYAYKHYLDLIIRYYWLDLDTLCRAWQCKHIPINQNILWRTDDISDISVLYVTWKPGLSKKFYY